MSPNSFPIRVDFYKGAYGPTLRLDTRTPEALRLLRDTFKALQEGTLEEYIIANNEWFALSHFDLLRLRRSSEATLGKRLKRLKSPTTVEFEWTLDSEGWRDCIALVGGILQFGKPSHQYLTNEGRDDALVELSYAEDGTS